MVMLLDIEPPGRLQHRRLPDIRSRGLSAHDMHAATQPELAIAGSHDFALTDAQFHRIRELVREHTGIALSDAKRQLVYGRLARRLRALQARRLRRVHRTARARRRRRARRIHQRDHHQPHLVLPRAASFRIPRDATCCRRSLPTRPRRAPRCASGAARPRPAKSRIPSPWCCAKRSELLARLRREAAGHGPGLRGARDRRGRHLHRRAPRSP